VTGGIVDSVLMRMVDGGLAIPRVLLLLVVAALWGNLGFFPLAVLLGLTGWFGVSRIIRAEVLSLKERTFLAAARALGLSQPRLVVRHILPNLVAPVTVTAALAVGNIVLIEASLSYLGIGARPPDPGWGNIIREGHELIFSAPWISIFPGAAIFLTVVGFSLIGDGLRTVLNPRAS
jgi:peptide/nickel transport system permease protein